MDQKTEQNYGKIFATHQVLKVSSLPCAQQQQHFWMLFCGSQIENLNTNLVGKFRTLSSSYAVQMCNLKLYFVQKRTRRFRKHFVVHMVSIRFHCIVPFIFGFICFVNVTHHFEHNDPNILGFRTRKFPLLFWVMNCAICALDDIILLVRITVSRQLGAEISRLETIFQSN